jgi:hypothetical protein
MADSLPTKEPRWFIFASVNGARFFNERWPSLQTPETRRDPRTVTKRLFSWSRNASTGKVGMKIPERYERHLNPTELAQLKTREQAEANNDIELGGRLDPESTARSFSQAASGQGGGQDGGNGGGNPNG